MKARKLKLGINMDNGWLYLAYRNRGQGPTTLGVMFLSRFSHLFIYLSSMKNFRNTFLGNYESQKAGQWGTTCMGNYESQKLDNGWMYCSYLNWG